MKITTDLLSHAYKCGMMPMKDKDGNIRFVKMAK